VAEPPGQIDSYIEHQTFVTEGAARWLVERGVTAVGVETACFEHSYERMVVGHNYDPGVTDPWPAHRICLASDVYVIEGLTNLDRVVGERVKFSAAPLPVPGSSGSPVRAYAWRDA
jgi:kynurenine formamidase